MERKLNKVIAGYHMLMILSNLDGDFSPREGDVIVKYLRDTFPFRIDLDDETDYLSTLKKEDYAIHFNKAMNDFYLDSTDEERAEFIDFAVKLVKADNVITAKENIYIRELFNAWDPDAGE